MKGRLVWFILLVTVFGGGGYWLWKSRSKASEAKVETAPVIRGNIRSRITATGNLQAVTQITVGSQVSGIIQALYVDFNTRVKKGQPLAQLDPSTFRAQVEQTTASVNNAEANLANSQANVGNQGANVKSSDAAITSAQAKVEASYGSLANAQAAVTTAEANFRTGQADYLLAQRNEKRQQTLSQRDLIASSDLDTARTTTLTSQANVDSLKSQIEAAKAGLRSALANLKSAQAEVEAARMRKEAAVQQYTSAQAQVRGAMAQVSQARANQSQAQTNLGFATIRSPIDGMVLDRKVTLGQTVAAQFQAPDLFTLAENLDQIQVQANIDEADIGQVKTGSRSTFTVDAYPEERFRGTVKEVRQAPVTVQNVVTYVVIVETRNDDGKLKPGMTATVNIQVDSREDVLQVPNSALRFKPPNAPAAPRVQRTPGAKGEGDRSERKEKRKSSLWTVDPQDPGKFVEHKVVPGITDGTNTELTETDLKEGDNVVTSAGGASQAGQGISKRSMRMF
ncbi:efflux RND transporter periplasmic adaptor subunit [bacterium]|nr:efflux RND transporter periplasmic adaptor subunit [bacterium]